MLKYCVARVHDPKTNRREFRVLVPDPHGEVSIGSLGEPQRHRIVRPGVVAALAGAEVQPPVQQPEVQQN